MRKTTGYLRLMRPANIVTSVADVLAGIAVSEYFSSTQISATTIFPVLLLCFSTIGLYGGGVVFNDVFDAELDFTERPERPIPSGLIKKSEAATLGSILLVAGILAALFVSLTSGILSALVAVSALVYNRWGKHHSFLGPLNMGLCRGLNLLLGISIIASALPVWWYLAFVPIIYIASITMISRGEVHGGSRKILYSASFLYSVVILFIAYFSWKKGTVFYALIFLLPFAWMIFKPLLAAIKEPIGRNIGKSVKAGVLALILMDASWAAAFGSVSIAIIILLLLPLSLKLARMFAVT